MTTVLRTRDQVDQAYLWKLDSYYTSDDLWETDYRAIEDQLRAFAAYAGRMTESSETVFAALSLHDAVSAAFDKLLVYAFFRRDEDTTNPANQARYDRAVALEVRFRTATAFFRPELLAADDQTIEAWFVATPDLTIYRYHLMNMRRLRAHTRSAEVEAVMMLAGEMAQSPDAIFGALNNADLRFGAVRDQNGEEIELSHGRVWSLLEQNDRHVRQTAWQQYCAVYQAHQTTFAATLNAAIRACIFNARARGYTSTLDAALDPDAIPPAVYSSLIDTVHAYLPVKHRYTRLRKQILGIDDLHFYDQLVPLAAPPQPSLGYDEAREIVLAALAPLGAAYTAALRRGLYEERWIDVYETAHKRSGAYSWGAYGSQSHILLNWQDQFSDLFMLAHEIGHAMHSYFSCQRQPYIYAYYTLFAAEVASTCNEALLVAHLLRTAIDSQQKRYLLGKQLDNINQTLFTQTMFAEFEREIHHRTERGEALAADEFTTIARRIGEEYDGPDMIPDDASGLFWAIVPHFYWNFYVYKYATGISAGMALAHQILTEGQPAVERYLNFLGSGGSADSIMLLQQAGVDMTTPKPVEQALQVYTGLVDQLEALSQRAPA